MYRIRYSKRSWQDRWNLQGSQLARKSGPSRTQSINRIITKNLRDIFTRRSTFSTYSFRFQISRHYFVHESFRQILCSVVMSICRRSLSTWGFSLLPSFRSSKDEGIGSPSTRFLPSPKKLVSFENTRSTHDALTSKDSWRGFLAVVPGLKRDFIELAVSVGVRDVGTLVGAHLTTDLHSAEARRRLTTTGARLRPSTQPTGAKTSPSVDRHGRGKVPARLLSGQILYLPMSIFDSWAVHSSGSYNDYRFTFHTSCFVLKSIYFYYCYLKKRNFINVCQEEVRLEWLDHYGYKIIVVV